MKDGHLAVSLVSELAEECVPCRETRTGLKKSRLLDSLELFGRPEILLGVGRLVETSLVWHLI